MIFFQLPEITVKQRFLICLGFTLLGLYWFATDPITMRGLDALVVLVNGLYAAHHGKQLWSECKR